MWTSTRSGHHSATVHGTARRGDLFFLPVDKIAMLVVFIDVMEATREVSYPVPLKGSSVLR